MKETFCRCGNYRRTSRYTGGPLCDGAHGGEPSPYASARMLTRVTQNTPGNRCVVLDCPRPTHGNRECYVHAKEYTQAD